MVEMPDGKRFKLGSGFSDAERENPPAIGAWVSYRYNGTNPSGLPRFARFLRVRDDMNSLATRGPRHFGSNTLSTT